MNNRNSENRLMRLSDSLNLKKNHINGNLTLKITKNSIVGRMELDR
ncbi:MAG: hypothetical protein ACI9CO_002253 [Candidatus Azotimanducaceae bacterium]|jgi:hypothetical protein